MGRTVSLFLVRAFGMLLAGMLLYAVFAPAHAQTDNALLQALVKKGVLSDREADDILAKIRRARAVLDKVPSE